ncbi:unnamed protein product, partial [Pylaiella littoralis]
MGNVVHVDEKRFYVCDVKQWFYARDDEPAPIRQVQHKNDITRVMFLRVVGQPRRNTSNNSEFSGKIRIYPSTVQERAQRNSRNRAAGTVVTKTVEVTKARYKKMMLVIPDMKLRFLRPPAAATGQRPPHLINDDPELRAAMAADGWDIRLINPPANSPDTNILDLSFFNSIQSLQDRTTPRSVDDLVKAVKEAWQKDPPAVLNRVWLSLQACLEQIMLAGGDNDYKSPHMRKGRLENAGTLPWQTKCKEEAWEKGVAALAE